MFATTLLGIRSLSSPSRLAARGRQQVLLRGMAAAPPASTKLELELVEVDNPNALNFILGACLVHGVACLVSCPPAPAAKGASATGK